MHEYKIKRNGRTIKKAGTFLSYEAARQWIRSFLRTQVKGGMRFAGPGMWDSVSRNPTNLTAYGFRIEKT
jgi:hypothetical protein